MDHIYCKKRILLYAVIVTGLFLLVIYTFDLQRLTVGLAQDSTPFVSRVDIACRLPNLDPFDKSISKYIAHPKGFDCLSKSQVQIFYALNGRLVANASAFNEQLDDTYCTCSFIDITIGHEDRINRTHMVHLDAASSLEFRTDIAEVVCKSPNGTIEYYDLVAYPRKISKKIDKTNEDQLSVVILAIDSTSLSIFRRNMRTSYDYLTNVMGSNVFEGYTKIGDNTFPNMVALLMGKRGRNEGNGMHKDYKENDRKMKFDNFPFIWKNFSAKGYVTMFNEDMPHMGMFHYQAKGFNNKPTDHYYRPYWKQWSKIELKHDQFCFQNRPEPIRQLEITRHHLIKYSGKRQFLFQFHTMLTHLNELDRIDFTFYDLLSEMKEGSYLNHSVLIVMSDHGHRFSSIRNTLVGLLEERLPIFAIYFPDWFLNKRPHIATNLKLNRHRLTSPFDVYETLLDIIAGNYDGTQRPPDQRGLSMLYPIPVNRTCKSAGIPSFFCVCSDSKTMAANDTEVVEGAKYITSVINGMLQNSTTTNNVCAHLTLDEILHAELFVSNDEVTAGVTNLEDQEELRKKATTKQPEIRQMRIAFSTLPSNAQFEALVENNFNSKTLRLGSTQISRTNMYRGQSDCISDKLLEKYCFCTK